MSDVQSSPTLSGRRILLVEDEYMIAADMHQAFERLGSVVVGPASRVEDALAMIEVDEIDCAVLDINLGGEPVWPVADALYNSGVPFVFTTGYDQSAIPELYAKVPRCEKPVNMKRLVQALLAS